MNISNIKLVKGAVLSLLLLPFIAIGSTDAATTDTTCEQLPTAIAAATAGDTINVTGNCTLNSTTTIDKALTIRGVGETTISTNGTQSVFRIVAEGTIIDNLNFVKTDKEGTQNIVSVGANDVSIQNSEFSGQYMPDDPQVSRGIEVSPGVKNVTISDNRFTQLRQPAYINDLVTGTVADNFVDGTKGFVVVANSNIKFTDNSWGNNAVDIAIIPGAPNNYTCEVVRQIRLDNNNAKVENQAQTTPCPKTFPANKDECKNNGFRTFTGQTYKNQGECVSSLASKQNKSNDQSMMQRVKNFFNN